MKCQKKINSANQNWAQTAMKKQSPADFKQILKEAREEQKKEDSERKSRQYHNLLGDREWEAYGERKEGIR